MSQEEKIVTLHPKQNQALNFTTQYCSAISGVQGGKTFVGAYWSALQIQDKNGDGLIVAPTFKILQQSTLPKFFSEFPQYRKYYKEQKSVIEFPWGNKVFIRSAQEPYSLEGMTLDWVWGDEAGQFSLLVWTILRSRTAIKKGKIFFTTTPYNMGWLYKDFFQPWKDGTDKDLTVVSWASVENPFFPKEFFEKERVRLRPEEFQRRYLGQFTKMHGLVYNFHSYHIVEPEEINSELTLGGVDWGYTNPCALVIIKYKNGRFFIVDEWYEVGKTTPEVIDAMIKLQRKHGVNRWYADSANPEKIKEASTNTGLYIVPYEKVKDSITHGISYIQQLMNENRLFVFNHCKNTLTESDSYHYPEEENDSNKKEEPVAENNHLMDAMRYAIHGYRPATRKYIEPPTAKSRIQEMLSIKIDGPQIRKTSFE